MTSTTRRYSLWASESVRRHLEDLLKVAVTADVEKYREAMRSLGAGLAVQIGPMIPAKGAAAIALVVHVLRVFACERGPADTVSFS